MTARVVAPPEVRCRWKLRAKHKLGASVLTNVHVCQDCKSWTANLPLYKDMVCPKKDRRRATRKDRRQA